MAKEEVSTSDGADRRQPAHSSAECDSPAASTSASVGSLWHPRQLGFGPYLHREDAAVKPQDSRFAARIPVSSCFFFLSALFILVNLSGEPCCC